MAKCLHNMGAVNGECINCGEFRSGQYSFDPVLRKVCKPIYGEVVDGRVLVRQEDVMVLEKI